MNPFYSKFSHSFLSLSFRPREVKVIASLKSLEKSNLFVVRKFIQEAYT